jgi:hypothetical protein
MELLQLDDFLKLFKKNKIEFNSFYKKAKVRSGSKLHPIKEYIQDKEISIEDVKSLWENIHDRDAYLNRFYKISLYVDPQKAHFENPMKNKAMDNNQNAYAKNLIRNIHFFDILQNTHSGIENNVPYLDMINDLYLHNIIDYKLLTPSSLFYIRQNRIGSVFSSYYFRASIMNPYLVYSLNESTLKGTKIFTPTLGWSSYCYGFLESPKVVEYVGTDVIPNVCKKTQELAKALNPLLKTDIYCKPSEDLLKTPTFLKKYKEHFDVVFFSPPYYKLELYEGGTQSTNKYKTYEEWLEKYWEKTIDLCFRVLETKGKLCYILSGYGSDSSTEQYDLLNDMNKITKKYFRLQSKQPMYNKNINVTKHREANEQIMIFVKD